MIDLKKAVELTKEKIKTTEIAKAILEKVLILSIREYQQKLNVGIQDSTSDLLNNFKSNIKEEMFNISNSWKPYNRDVFCLFPQNCRFFFSKSVFDVLVIEEKPQLRTVRINKLADHRRYGLHIPYSVFVFVFKNSKFVEMYNGWRKAPLSSLEDKLYEPILPNIHEDLAVCIGKNDKAWGESICQTVENLIEYFWSSEFNSDLSRHKPKFSAVDWENNPDYALNFELKEICTLRQLIKNSYHAPEFEVKLQHKLSSKIDELADSLFKKIMTFFQEKKFEKYYPKDIKDNMEDALNYVFEEYNSIINVMELEIKNQDNLDIGWEKGGRFWNDE